MSNLDTCGIEVSAKELVVRLRRGEDLEPLRNFPNTPEGHLIILRYLRRAGRVVRVCLESTGLYGLDLALALSGQEGLEVRVANPRVVRHFAQALMQRSKNDQIDAGVDLIQAPGFRLPSHPSANTLRTFAVSAVSHVRQRTLAWFIIASARHCAYCQKFLAEFSVTP